MSDPTPSPGALVADHFARIEVALLARVLATTLAAVLPPSMIRVERVRSAADVIWRRPGQAVGVTIRSGTVELGFRAPEVGVTDATVKHVVRGIVLSTEQVGVAEWLARLGALLDERAGADADAGRALQRFLTDRT